MTTINTCQKPACQYPSCHHVKTLHVNMPKPISCHNVKHMSRTFMPKASCQRFDHAKILHADNPHAIMSIPFMPTCQNLFHATMSNTCQECSCQMLHVNVLFMSKYSMPITLMPSCQHPSCQHAKTYLMPQCQTHAKKMPKPNNIFFHAKTLYANIHHVSMSTPFMPTCQNLISR